MSLRDKILAADDLKSEHVEIPEWGVTVEVREMDGAARTRVMGMVAEGSGLHLEEAYPEVVVECAFDPETGERVFEAADKPVLMSKSGAALDRIAETALRLSGMSDGSVDAAGKDSSGDPT